MNFRNLKLGVARAALSASFSAGLLTATAIAQETTAEDETTPTEATKTLQTVTVTSQKREQNILDVPVAVTAVTAEQLENSGVQNFRDLTRVSPSLTVNENNTANSSSITLRGIGTYAFSTGVEPSVSVVIDDVANARQLQAFSNLSDIERVEVLRGPQGTLFGKNASAGVISVVTKGPSDVLTGYAEGTITDDDEYRINGSLSGPLGDTAGFRLNAYYADREGHIDNLSLGTKVGGDDGFGVRGKFQWDPSENLEITFIGDYSERNTEGTALTLLDVPDGAAFLGFVPFAAISAGITPGEDNFNTRLSDDPTSESEALSLTGRVVYDFGNFELTSITNYQESDYEFFADVDGTDFDIQAAFSGGLASGGITQGGPFSTEQISQEFRLSSSVGDDFEYLIGLFYADSETERSFMRGPLFPANWFGTAGSETLALFGQGTINFSDETRLTGGIRFGTEKVDVVYNEVTPAATFQGDIEDDYVTGKLALQHDITPNTMVFGSVSTGYKGQGFDLTTGFNQNSIDNPVGSETSLSFEIGAKGRAMDGRFQYSLVGFTTEYDGFQAQSAVVDPVTLAAEFRLENVGELETQGIELDVAAQLTDALRVDAGIALIDATIKSFPAAQCFPGQTVAEGCVGGIQDLAGSDLANAPDLKFNVGAVYETEIPGIGFNAVIGANYNWQDDVNFDLFANPRTVQDSYGIANFRLGLVESENQNYEITLFVNNAFDKVYASQILDFGALYGGTPVMAQTLSRNARRHVGVKLKAGF